MKIGIIGVGYWGPNLVRNFMNIKNCQVTHVVDLQSERLTEITIKYPQIIATNSTDDIITNPEIDAVVIATPVKTHTELAIQALESRKHVLIEKPMTNSSKDAKKIIDLSKEKGKTLMVDHTYLYTGAVQKIKELVENGSIGNIQYIHSTRMNLGIFRPDINVLWDLAPHDISICNYLMKEKPIAVQALGKSHTDSSLEDIAYLTLHYNSEKIAQFNCSWISPIKIRQMLIGGDKKMIMFDDLESTKKLEIFDTNYRKIKQQVDEKSYSIEYQVGEAKTPEISLHEGLSVMAEDFVTSILQNSEPISNHEIGFEVVNILEGAQNSIINNGKKINLAWN